MCSRLVTDLYGGGYPRSISTVVCDTLGRAHIEESVNAYRDFLGELVQMLADRNVLTLDDVSDLLDLHYRDRLQYAPEPPQ